MSIRNKVQLVGHLGAAPEMKTMENGNKLARLNIATNESYKTQSGEWKEETTWHNAVCWRQLAERAERQLNKGSHVLIEGRLTNRDYTDKDGIKRYITEVLVEGFMLLDKRTDAEKTESEPVNSSQDDSGLPF